MAASMTSPVKANEAPSEITKLWELTISVIKTLQGILIPYTIRRTKLSKDCSGAAITQSLLHVCLQVAAQEQANTALFELGDDNGATEKLLPAGVDTHGVSHLFYPMPSAE
jgi:hypothetical protein